MRNVRGAHNSEVAALGVAATRQIAPREAQLGTAANLIVEKPSFKLTSSGTALAINDRRPSHSSIMAAAALLCATNLSGCLGSGSGSLEYDPAIRNAPGTITLGDAKVYSREMLINERAADIAWIDKLIAASEDPTKVSFKPTLLREMEEISAFSAVLGVRYDPAAAMSYRRSTETGEIQQQIDVLKAQIQLEQLRRDIELIRAKLPEQTEPVNSGLTTLGTGGAVTAAGSTVTPPDAAQVITTLNALITSVTARLDAETKPIGKTEVVSGPADDFRDRLAYRDMLKAVRNALGLDELHDAGNNRLIRLNLQATVIPDTRNVRALGAIQVRIDDQTVGGPESYLSEWLRWANVNGDWRVDAGTFRSSATLDALEDSGDFARARIGAVQTVLPVLVSQNGGELVPQNLFDRADWDKDVVSDRVYFGRQLAALSVSGEALETALTGLCQPGSSLALALDVADARVKSYELIRSVNLAAVGLGAAPAVVDAGTKYDNAANYQNQVIGLVRNRPGCEHLVWQYAPANLTWRVRKRPELGGSQQVRIYEVGPREQAQQVSTVARSAKSLALAVALAASAPSAGVAGNLGAGFRRDIMNRASALDRVPEVVGYSVGGKRTFGWVVGPHATTDSRGRAEVRQVAKTYDLSVDLSVPSWWNAMNLKVTTVWAPSPQMLTDGSLRVAADKKGVAQQERDLPVPLTAAAADYQSFTQFLIRNSRRPVELQDVIGGPVTGCVATTLFLKGPNVWRAQKVLLLGVSLGQDAFVIAPDMAGIIVTVPAIAAIPGERAYKENDQIRVLTPLGEGQHAFQYDPTLSGDSCKPKAEAAEDRTAVTVSKAEPASFVVPSLIRIDVTGTNLTKVDEVRLDGRKGTITARADEGKGLTVEFARDLAEGMEPGSVKLEFFTKRKSVGTAQTIRIVRDRS